MPFEKTFVETNIGVVHVVKLLGKGKSGYSYLAERNGERVVFKQMHNEPCSYYTFTDNKVRLELHAYKELTDARLSIPTLLTFDVERNFLVKEYIDGEVTDQWSPDTAQLENVIEQLFTMAHNLEDRRLNIDYFPANFVVKDSRLHYIDYEINPYLEQWNLVQWGLYYWANRSGMLEYSRTGDWRHINISADSGLPIKSPFEEQVRLWCNHYGRS